LRRKFGSEIFYWKGTQEVDFYIPHEKLLVNVSYDISEKKTYDREVNGLVEAMKALKLKKAVLVTAQKQDVITVEKLEIAIMPLWKWLTQK
jgi:predicted AAA+ superfamily ATPase